METDLLSILGPALAFIAMLCIAPFIIFIAFPLFQSLSREKRFEKFVDDQCIQGNQIAILIRRERMSYLSDRDHKLMQAAIEGNENAIKALKLDPESQKHKYF